MGERAKAMLVSAVADRKVRTKKNYGLRLETPNPCLTTSVRRYKSLRPPFLYSLWRVANPMRIKKSRSTVAACGDS
jgi:hypothetical protein